HEANDREATAGRRGPPRRRTADEERREPYGGEEERDRSEPAAHEEPDEEPEQAGGLTPEIRDDGRLRLGTPEIGARYEQQQSRVERHHARRHEDEAPPARLPVDEFAPGPQGNHHARHQRHVIRA